MRDENILNKIIERKKNQVKAQKFVLDPLIIKNKITEGHAPPLRPFVPAIKKSLENKGIAVISELKKASPSKGIICHNYNPEKIAQDYERHGATCLSVLTEKEFFLGSDEDLFAARRSCSLPILRKDFIVDEYQIMETRYIGADCILLIVAALSEQQFKDYYQKADELGLAVLIEVADEAELELALTTDAILIGINNRNLKDFTVNLENTVTLAKLIPDNRIVICESGIRSRADIECMQKSGVNTFLIGETLMKCDSPGEQLALLLGSP